MTAQIVTSSENENESVSIQQVIINWTSTDAGVVSFTSTKRYSGALVNAVIVPLTSAPTSGYVVTVKDSNNIDLLAGNGASCSATLTAYYNQGNTLGIVYDSQLTLAISGAGNATSGKIVLYIAPF